MANSHSGNSGRTLSVAALADLPDLAARLSADLRAAAIPHAVSGALAMAAYGYVRATRDIDILVAVSAVRLPQVFEIVRTHGFKGEDRELIESLRERYMAEMRAGPVSVEILVPVLPYHHTLIDRSVSLQVAGTEVPFISSEDLIVLKTLWHRTKDLADVKVLLAALGEKLDRDYVARTLEGILGERLRDVPEIQQVLDQIRE